MSKPILASAAFVLLATVSSSAFAEGLDRTKFRQLVVEPKAAEATANRVAINPGDIVNKIAAAPRIAIEPKIAIEPDLAPAERVDVLPIVVEPKQNPVIAAPPKQNKVIAVAPKKVAPRLNIDPRPRPEPAFEFASAEPAGRFEEPAPAPVFEAAPADDFVADAAPEVLAPQGDVAGMTALYGLLTSRGYAVEILKNDEHGRYVLGVSGQGSVYLLVVDGASGDVLRKKLVSAHAAPVYKAPAYKAPVAAYKAPIHAAPRYSPVAKAPAYDNCDAGYVTADNAHAAY